MKALEVTIYPPIHRPRYGYEIDPYREQWKRERKIIESKRLTDHELAAEYWRSREDTAYIVEGITWESMADEWSISEADALDRAHVLSRFATLPHYDEDQP